MKLTRDEHLYFNACAKALLACPDVQSMSAFTQHGRVSCLEHSLSVAYYSYWLCRRLRLRVDGGKPESAAPCCTTFSLRLHTVGRQYGLLGFTHPATALKNARAALPPVPQGGERHRQPYVAPDTPPPPPVQGSRRRMPYR